MIEKMKELAKKRDICVMATASENNPHCSLMAYVTDEDCSEIYMVTSKESRKYRNLVENPHVSLLIDTREEHAGPRRLQAQALTVGGVYRRIDDEEKKDRIRGRLLNKHPHVKELLDQPDSELLCIRIESLLLLDGLTDAHYEVL